MNVKSNDVGLRYLIGVLGNVYYLAGLIFPNISFSEDEPAERHGQIPPYLPSELYCHVKI